MRYSLVFAASGTSGSGTTTHSAGLDCSTTKATPAGTSPSSRFSLTFQNFSRTASQFGATRPKADASWSKVQGDFWKIPMILHKHNHGHSRTSSNTLQKTPIVIYSKTLDQRLFRVFRFFSSFSSKQLFPGIFGLFRFLKNGPMVFFLGRDTYREMAPHTFDTNIY